MRSDQPRTIDIDVSKATPTVLYATLIAGTLDILSACVYAAMAGQTPIRMLGSISAAVVRSGADMDPIARALIGLCLHYAIMAAMAGVFVIAATRWRALIARPLSAGIAYGLVTWAIMNLIVLPLRWPTLFPRLDLVSLAQQMFSHIVLVGLPIASIARRHLARLTTPR